MHNALGKREDDKGHDKKRFDKKIIMKSQERKFTNHHKATSKT